MFTLPLSESSESFVVAGTRAGLGISLYSSSSGIRSGRRGGRSPRGRSPRGGSGCCMTKSQPITTSWEVAPRNGCQPLRAYRSPVRCANPPSAEKRLVSGVRVLGFSVDCVWSVLVTTFDCFRLLVSPRSSGEISQSLQSGILDVDAVCSTTSFSAAQGGSFRPISARPRHEPTQGDSSVAVRALCEHVRCVVFGAEKTLNAAR